MNKIKCALCNKDWWAAALVRAIKTMAQCALGFIGASVIIQEVNWLYVLSGMGLAGISSLLTSLAGLPEVENVTDQ